MKSDLEVVISTHKTNRLVWITGTLLSLLLLAAAVIYVWFYRYNACDVQAVETASAFLAGQLNSYDALYQVATTAYQTELTRPLYVMQQIFMDTQEFSVPACMQTARSELLNYMETVIGAFQVYGASGTDAAIRDLLNQSDMHINKFFIELDAVQKCAPYCAPWD